MRAMDTHQGRALRSRAGGRIALAGGAVALVALAFGIAHLFRLRFESGDVYPEYSTFRADPKGCRVLYEAFGRLDEFDASRNLEAFDRLAGIEDAAVFFLGVPPGDLVEVPLHEAEVLEARLEEGTRLVVTVNGLGFVPNIGVPVGTEAPDEPKVEAVEDEAPTEEDAGASVEAGEPGDDRGAGDGDEDEDEDLVRLTERWGFRLEFEEVDDRPDGGWPVRARGSLEAALSAGGDGGGEGGPAVEAEDGGGPGMPSWLSVWRFGALDESWEVLAETEAGGYPVLVRRAFGAGELVMASGSYFASNQALWQDPSTALLRELTGGRRRLLFDETHLGTMTDPGIATLIRRYRLHGLFFGLAVLAALYAWRSGSSLVPPDAAAEERRYADHTVMGADAATGFSRLLRRTVPASGLLSVCYREWFRSAARRPGFTDDQADRIIGLIREDEGRPSRRRRPEQAYNRILAIVAEEGGARRRPGTAPDPDPVADGGDSPPASITTPQRIEPNRKS